MHCKDIRMKNFNTILGVPIFKVVILYFLSKNANV